MKANQGIEFARRVVSPWALWALWLLTGLFTHVSARAVDNTEVTVAKSAANEQQDRQVDLVALSAQELAISRLSTLLKKYRETSQEPVLLAKLADFQQQKAAIEFRVAHSVATHGKRALDLSLHHRTSTQAIATLDRLIRRYPGFEEIPHAYFMRGKSYEEIENKAKAGQDYLYLVQHFPNAEDSTNCYMSLADFAIEANDHKRALGFLKEVEKRPEDPHYPFALYKMAWSYYNLKAIPEALSYAERQIHYYDDRAKQSETGFAAESDRALRENTLLDLAVFYFEGYEQKGKAYSLDNALDYFKRLEKGPVLGKILLRFAKLLRSHSHEEDLLSWKAQVLASHSSMSESLDILILAYEYELNNHHYPQVVSCARDMVSLYAAHKTFESFPKAQKQVLDTAENLQTAIVKASSTQHLSAENEEVAARSRILAQLYDAFVHLVEETDPRIPRAHYNLAETLFTIRDYNGATEHYRWVVEHGKWDAKPPRPAKVAKKDAEKGLIAEATVPDASLKAIAARYEILRQKGLIPKELQAKSLPSKDPSSSDPLLSQWVQWLDTHLEHSLDGTENFVFESNRALYAQGQIRRAVERMAAFSAKHPKSSYAIPQASLVLDTYIATQDWEKTHDTATEFMKVPEWRQGDFSSRLFAVASDAFYKQLEARFRARDYKGTLSGCDEFLKRYATSARLGDTLALAGSAALESIDRKRAMAYFTRLIAEVPQSPNVPTALLARATTEEDHYLFAPAASDYRAYVARMVTDKSADGKQLESLRRKSLMLIWLSGDRGELKAALADKSLCTEKLAAECERYAILNQIENPLLPRAEKSVAEKSAADAFDKARHGDYDENRGLWAILALKGGPHLSFRDRNQAAIAAAKGWDSLDPIVKFAMIPHLSRDLATAFRLNRAALKDVAPLKARANWITRRVEVIREIENAATKVMKLPWARVRAVVLNEVAGVYLDLARGLSALPQPKDLTPDDQQAYDETIRKITMPFEEKGQDMRAKAFEIASRFAIEESSMAMISEPFFAENPSQAKALKGADQRTPAALEPLGVPFLAKVESREGWGDVVKHPEREVSEDLAYDNPAAYLKAMWARSLQTQYLQQTAFFMQEAQEKALIQAGVMGAVKAISLAAAGARGEAFAELEESRRDLPPDAQAQVTRWLAQVYERSYAREKAANLLKELKEPPTVASADSRPKL